MLVAVVSSWLGRLGYNSAVPLLSSTITQPADALVLFIKTKLGLKSKVTSLPETPDPEYEPILLYPATECQQYDIYSPPFALEPPLSPTPIVVADGTFPPHIFVTLAWSGKSRSRCSSARRGQRYHIVAENID